MKHGTITGYTHHKCRCAECTAAWSEYMKEYKRGRRRRADQQPKPIPHGTLNGYNRHECRCEQCRAASAAYARQRRALAGAGQRVVQTETCIADGCDRVPLAKNLCAMHYSRWKTTGDLGPAQRKIAQRGEGHLSPVNGYRIVRAGGRNVFEHRVVMEQMLGRPLLPNETVHHKNGNRADNRPENLELWAKGQPSGQRAIDKLAWAREIVALYEPVEDVI